MNIVLLSGGSGKRLWPLSNDVRSKQFIKIFNNGDGDVESMVQRMYNKILCIDSDARITIATSKTQVSAIKNQIGDDVGISIEPCRRDTFPAIVLASLYLRDIHQVNENEEVVICPVDPYVEDEYFKALKDLSEVVNNNDCNIALLGIKPTYPSEKYGYIIPKEDAVISQVISFKEKPSVDVAEKYIKQGALWNGGVFAFKLSYIIKKAHELIDFKDYHDLLAKYKELDKISFDYAVVEKESKINVMRFDGEWKDLGTWNTLTEAMPKNIIGNGKVSEDCKNVHIINELDIPILGIGLENVVISASPEGVLVSEKNASSRLKDYMDENEQPIMFAEKSWGTYKVLEIGDESLVIKVSLKSGEHMNYHSHRHRDEVWTVISGEGETTVDGFRQSIKTGDVIAMDAGCRHTVKAITDLELIEVQLGKDISVDDKEKFELEY